MTAKTVIKRILIALLALLLTLVTVAGGYIAYVLIDDHRLPDDVPLTVEGAAAGVAPTGQALDIVSYNIGFAAYTPDFGFFMDGGTESRAASPESVHAVMAGIGDVLARGDYDFLLVEEVDKDATRSHHIDQTALLGAAFADYHRSFVVNYDSPYLFYPFNEPHGKSLSGMLTFSRFAMSQSVRRSLPVEDSLLKLVDLDRCYSVTHIPTDNGRELVLYTVHLSAYTSDGTIATKQLELLLADMRSEYEKGNYTVCGGDFNKDLLGDSSRYFGVSGEAYTWAQPFPTAMLEGSGLTLQAPLDEKNPVPSCRNADAPYHEGQFVLTVDGFIVSDNVTVTASSVLDLDFAYSDHNPVTMTFILEP